MPDAKTVQELAIETYLAHVIDGHSMREVAAMHGVAASTVMRRVRQIEDARDDPAFEAKITQLEQSRTR